MPQKATKASVASSTAPASLNLPEKSRPAKTKTFLIHSCGRPVLIAARSGERRGTTRPPAVESAGTVGCSEVIGSMCRGRVALRYVSEGCYGSIKTPGFRIAAGSSSFLAALRACLLYTSDAADDLLCVDLGGRR